MRAIIIGSSTVIIFVVGVFFVRTSVINPWRTHQQRYRTKVETIAKSDAERDYASEFRVKLRQQDLPELGRVDRCITCHVGIEDPRMAGEGQPLTSHPGTYLVDHDVERFGCTICHDGQGRATEWRDALGRDADLHFERPLLDQPFLQARCYRCHLQDLAGTPVYNRGKQLFRTNGCLGCHRIQGRGGSAGPTLDGISDAAPSLKHVTEAHHGLLAEAAGNRNVAYIVEAIRYPKAQPADSVMFDFAFSKEDALALAVYVKSFEKTEVVARSYIPRERIEIPDDRNERGRGLYLELCSACHGAEGEGGRANPNASTPEIPNLDALNERMMLFERSEAVAMFDALERDPGELPDVDELDLEVVTEIQYQAITAIIRKGNRSGKVDADGAAPIDMPAWGEILSDDELVAILSYLVGLGEFDDDED